MKSNLRRALVASLIAGSCFAVGPPGLAQGRHASPPTSPPRTIAHIRALSPEQASLRHPVALDGVVSFTDPLWGLLFVRDATAGIFVSLPEPIPLAAGDAVRLEGVTGPGDFAPVVIATRVVRRGHPGLPPARPLDVLQAMHGGEDSQWVETTGVIHRVALDREAHLTADLVSHGITLQVMFAGAWRQPLPTHLVDAEVRVSGVLGTVFNQKRQLRGLSLFVTSLDSVVIARPSVADAFDRPRSRTSDVHRFPAAAAPSRRLRVRGIVTASESARLVIEDADGGLTIVLAEPVSPAPAIGTEVDAVGFPALTPGSTELRWSQVRATGAAARPPELPVRPIAELLAQELDTRLVRVTGRLLNAARVGDGQFLTVQDGPHVYTAYLPVDAGRPPASAAPGARLELTGVTALEYDTSRNPHVARSVQIRLRGPGDMRLLEAPPWWTSRQTALLAAGLGLGALAALGWVVLLRWRVRAQTALIALREDARGRARAAVPGAVRGSQRLHLHVGHSTAA